MGILEDEKIKIPLSFDNKINIPPLLDLRKRGA
jgi:hypothetical protein